MTLGTRLVSSFLGCGLIPLGIVAYVSYNTAQSGMGTISQEGSTALESAAYGQLVALREVKKSQIESYFSERKGDMGVLAANVDVLRENAFTNLAAIQKGKSVQVENLMRRMRADAMSFANSTDAKLAFADFDQYLTESTAEGNQPFDTGTAAYQEIYKNWYDVLAKYVKNYGYYDAFLIHGERGDVLFTEAKEGDLGQNLVQGPQKEEGLARLWRQVADKQQVAFSDFSPYSPSGGKPAAFVGAPVYDSNQKLIAVAALQLPTDPINAIAQSREGLGQSGETYLVGLDQGKTSFRSDMLTMGDGKYVVGAEIDTEYIDKAIAGQSGQEVMIDSSGTLVMVSYQPLKIEGLNWAQVTKMNIEEAVALKAAGEKEDFLTKYNNMYGYYDLFLISPDGFCFYSVCHEADYQTNLINGKYQDSNLGHLVQQCLNTREFGFADFAPYAPSNGTPAAFIAQPIVSRGQVELIIALQLPLDAINRIMGVRDGMGKTGETYLIGPNKLMRSDSFLDPTHHTVAASFANPAKGSVDTDAANAALRGETDAKIITDYNGNPVLSAYTPINVFGTTWGLLAEIDESEALAAVKNMETTSRQANTSLLTWVGILGGAAAILVTLISIFISRSISRPINRIIDGLNEGADQVNEAASQVSSASQQLAEGASEQASSLEETSAALEEMAAMTRANAENAKRADDLSNQAREAAQSGDTTMQQLNQAMAGINESSEKISKIIKVIEEIAFQTNLLALNAAVEAARAGEHGKGFAVVADEVRNLAQRAAAAAGETTTLIGDSVNKAQSGTAVAAEVGKSLGTIVGDVTKVTDLINGIAKASEEQAQGVDQVNTAVGQMDKVTQQNASSAEESASAAEELSAQAATVKGMVDELSALISGSQQGDRMTGTSAPRSSKQPSQKKALATPRVHKPVLSRTSAPSGHTWQQPPKHTSSAGHDEFADMGEARSDDLTEF